MQDEEAGDRRRACPADQAIGIQRDTLVAGVTDRLGNGEEVVLVEGNAALEDQALAIVPGQRHWRFGSERAAVRAPWGLRTGYRHVAPGTDPAMFSIVCEPGSRRREQLDEIAILLHCLPIIVKNNVVDAGSVREIEPVIPWD